LSRRGTGAGLDEIEAGLREVEQIGAGRLKPLHFSLAADAYSLAGRHGDARVSIDKAFAALEHDRDQALAAELHRKRAALLMMCAGAADRGLALVDLLRALEIARRQKAKSLELRAARDLARLMADRGEGQQAADLLSPVYGGFTEGFDTADLKEAKALLDELGLTNTLPRTSVAESADIRVLPRAHTYR
jgi:predicted ATPase